MYQNQFEQNQGGIVNQSYNSNLQNQSSNLPPKKKNPIGKVLFVLVLCIGSAIGGYYGGNYYFSKTKEVARKKEEVDDSKKEEKVKEELSNKELQKLGINLTKPFMEQGDLCSTPINFFKNKSYTFDSISEEDKVNLVYYNYALDNVSENIFQDIETGKKVTISLADLDKYVEKLFGKGKKINYPQKVSLNQGITSYELKNNKYVLSGYGGGCTGPQDQIVYKVVSTEEVDDKIVITIDFVYKYYDRDSLDSEGNNYNLLYNIYEGFDMKKILLSNVKEVNLEKEVDDLLWGDNTNYYVYTFINDGNGNYIFDSIKLEER